MSQSSQLKKRTSAKPDRADRPKKPKVADEEEGVTLTQNISYDEEDDAGDDHTAGNDDDVPSKKRAASPVPSDRAKKLKVSYTESTLVEEVVEEVEPGQQLVVATQASSAVARIKPPVPDDMWLVPTPMDQEDEPDDAIGTKEAARLMNQQMLIYKGLEQLAKRRNPCVQTRDPYLSQWLADVAMGTNMRPGQLVQGLVAPCVKKSGKGFINVNATFPKQKMLDGRGSWGEFLLSPPFKPRFFKYGATVEDGVNGNQGKVTVKSDGSSFKVERYKEAVECTLSNDPIHPDMCNSESGDAPPMTAWLKAVDAQEAVIWAAAYKQPTILSYMKSLVPVLKDPEAARQELKKMGKYLGKVKKGDNPFDLSLSVKVSCYRSPGKTESHGPGGKASSMFERNYKEERENEKGEIEEVFHLQREIPCYRVRHPSEVVEGEVYKSPYIRIPHENVRLTQNDILMAVLKRGFYEKSAKDECAFKYELVELIWLNTYDELAKLDINQLPPCKPWECSAMAGKYVGPMDLLEMQRAAAQAALDQQAADDQAMAQATDQAEAALAKGA